MHEWAFILSISPRPWGTEFCLPKKGRIPFDQNNLKTLKKRYQDLKRGRDKKGFKVLANTRE